MHKFHPSNKSQLDNEWRREVLPPKETLEQIGLAEGDIVADIGCGIGYFSIPAAEIVGPGGRVYALDTSSEMLSEVESRASLARLQNVETVHSGEYDLKLVDSSVTFALLVNVLHEIDERERFVREARRVLRPGGRLAIVEWEKKETPMGPPASERISREEVEGILAGLGFEVDGMIPIRDIFYAITAVNK